jgi:protein-S-isoprenylcysteine O-methyltransferase Ste14
MQTPNQDHPHVVAPPPLIFAACLAVGLGLHWLWPVSLPLRFQLRNLGVVLVVIAASLALSAGIVMRKARTSIRPDKPSTTVVTAGPFGYTRNPLYLSLCLLNAGIALRLGGLIPLLMTVVLATILHQGVILREEKYLAGKFGSAYADYCSRVRRWL